MSVLPTGGDAVLANHKRLHWALVALVASQNTKAGPCSEVLQAGMLLFRHLKAEIFRGRTHPYPDGFILRDGENVVFGEVSTPHPVHVAPLLTGRMLGIPHVPTLPGADVPAPFSWVSLAIKRKGERFTNRIVPSPEPDTTLSACSSSCTEVTSPEWPFRTAMQEPSRLSHIRTVLSANPDTTKLFRKLQQLTAGVVEKQRQW